MNEFGESARRYLHKATTNKRGVSGCRFPCKNWLPECRQKPLSLSSR